MQFTIHHSIFDRFPDLQIVALIVRGIDNSGSDPAIQDQQALEQNFTRGVFSVETLSSHPNIAVWRKAYTLFGAGSHYRSSVEALVRRTMKGETLPTINKLVDLYNIASLKYLVPIGGEDLNSIKGGVQLKRATGMEPFVPLGETDNDAPEAGEIIYADDAGCLCRRFNWREADRTKLTEHTKNALLTIEGLPPVGEIEVKEAASALQALITRFCGGTSELFLLNHTIPSITFTI